MKNIKKEKKKNKFEIKRGDLPQKRTINLIGIGQTTIEMKMAVPGIIIIILAALLFSKFAVVNRLIAVSEANSRVSLIQEQLDLGYAKIESYGDMTEAYAHYTYSGMTPEELGRADRMEVLQLLEEIVLPRVDIDFWSISGNQMTLSITGSALQQINLIVQRLEVEELVDYCTVTTAATKDNTQMIGSDTDVTAQITIYLKDATEEDK